MPHVRLFPEPLVARAFQIFPLDDPVFRDDGPDGRRFSQEIRDPRPWPDEQAYMRERAGILLAALRRLPGQERLLIRLRHGLGFRRCWTLQEIADRAGITKEGVRQRLLRAEEDLRSVIRTGGIPARGNRRAFPGGYRRRA